MRLRSLFLHFLFILAVVPVTVFASHLVGVLNFLDTGLNAFASFSYNNATPVLLHNLSSTANVLPGVMAVNAATQIASFVIIDLTSSNTQLVSVNATTGSLHSTYTFSSPLFTLQFDNTTQQLLTVTVLSGFTTVATVNVNNGALTPIVSVGPSKTFPMYPGCASYSAQTSLFYLLVGTTATGQQLVTVDIVSFKVQHVALQTAIRPYALQYIDSTESLLVLLQVYPTQSNVAQLNTTSGEMFTLAMFPKMLAGGGVAYDDDKMSLYVALQFYTGEGTYLGRANVLSGVSQQLSVPYFAQAFQYAV